MSQSDLLSVFSDVCVSKCVSNAQPARVPHYLRLCPGYEIFQIMQGPGYQLPDMISAGFFQACGNQQTRAVFQVQDWKFSGLQTLGLGPSGTSSHTFLLPGASPQQRLLTQGPTLVMRTLTSVPAECPTGPWLPLPGSRPMVRALGPLDCSPGTHAVPLGLGRFSEQVVHVLC